MLISNLLFIISTITFIYAHNYITFIIAIITNAINNSLSSGITNSILYENLDNKDRYNKILFYNSFFYNISYMLAMIIGGYIGQKFGLIYTYYITIIPFIIDFIVLLVLKIKNNINTANMESNISILKNGFKEVINNSYLLKLILTSSILFSGIKLVEESHPEYSNNIGISVFVIGIYTALILVFCIIGSYIGSRLKRNTYKLILNINPIFSGLCILLVGKLNNYFGIVFILLIYIFSESFDNIMKAELHKNISSKSRVTIESINQFVLSIFGIIFSILMTILLKFMSISTMYMLIGFIIISYGIVNLIVDDHFSKAK